MTHTHVDKHAWSATAETTNLVARTTTRKIVAIIRVNREGTTRIKARKTGTTIAHTRRITMVISRSRPLPLPPALLLKCALEPPTTGAEILTSASLEHSVPAIDTSTAVRHRRGHLFRFQKILVYLLPACPNTQHNLPRSRAHGLLRYLLTIPTALYRRWELALRAWFPPTRCFFPRLERGRPATFPSVMV